MEPFHSSCYLGIKTDFILNYTMAEQIYRKEHSDSHLPSVNSLAEITFIVKLGLGVGWFGYKIGVYLGGKLVDGNVIWTDGRLLEESILPFLKQYFSCHLLLLH